MSETHSVNPLERTSDPTPTGNPALSPILNAVNQALGERLGVGGMGEVYRIGDPALQRDLAIKVLKETLRGNADAEERFLREARLTGSLQHPAIVPVHQLGRLADGRPYYTMKLVRGRTFADLIHEEAQGPERLPRLLAIVEKVCQAVAYAHSKGVIHRDLKPGNVMVGEFGEVQVMDWGLAKELSRDEPVVSAEATENVETVARVEEGEGLSRAGLALGTPEYMPPEQAAGDWDIVDQRADVFALGAILCAVLAGRPPYCGGSRHDLLRRARRGDLAEALGQLEKCGADAVLVALCRECLAAERLQRPRHAGVVAERLASYQAEVRERLRQSELERARAEVKRLEERKRRRLLALMGTTVLVLVVGGLLRWRAKANEEVAEALGQARSLRRQASSEVLTASGYDQAVAAAQHAVEIARKGAASAEMRRQAEKLLVEVQQEAEAAVKDRRLLAALLDVHNPHEGPKYNPNDKGRLMTMAEPTKEEQFASAFREWGLEVDAVSTPEAVARLKARPAVVVTEVIAALDEWMNARRVDRKPEAALRLVNLAAALDDDPDSLRRELREIQARLPLDRALAELSAALRPAPVSLPVFAPLLKDLDRLRQLADRIDPASEPVLSLLMLTRALQAAGEEASAERLLRAALTARPREVVLYHTLGQLLTEQKPPRWAEAVEFYRATRSLRPDLGVDLAYALLRSGHAGEGLALLARMVRATPGNPYLPFQHGVALIEQGKWTEAEEANRKAIDLKPDYAMAYQNLGVILNNSQRKYVEAEAAFRKAIVLQPDLAVAYANLGVVLCRQEKYAEAEAACRKAIALEPNRANAYSNLGYALNGQKKLAEAEAACRKAIALQPDRADAYNQLGYTLSGQGKYAEAEAAHRKAIALKPDLATAHNNLGVILNDRRGKYAEAEMAFRRAIALKPDDTEAYLNLGIALIGRGKYGDAEAALRKAIALKPSDAAALYGLGISLKGQSKFAAAERAYRKAIALKPDYAEAHCNLGVVLRDQGRFAESLAAFRRGHKLGTKRSHWPYPSLQWVREVERMVELERKLPAILQGEASPVNANDAISLASMCKQPYQKRYAASARLYAYAFAAEPKLAADMEEEHRYSAACHAALAAAGQGEDARLLPDKATAMFRYRALNWLRDDLTAYAKLADQNNPRSNKMIQQRMAHWRSDADLATVRDPQALDRLSDNERAAWQALWRAVDELRSRVEKRDGPTTGR